MKLHKGFTLIELMIVVAIVAILASVAIPAYNNYVIQGKLVEGTSTLSDGRIKVEQFFQDHLTYVGANAAPPCPAATTNFTYTCTNLTVSTYTITATGIGSLSNFSYTINESNLKQTTGLNPDWITVALPVSCWITKSGATC